MARTGCLLPSGKNGPTEWFPCPGDGGYCHRLTEARTYEAATTKSLYCSLDSPPKTFSSSVSIMATKVARTWKEPALRVSTLFRA